MSIILILLSLGLATLYSASAYLALQGGLSDSAYLLRQILGVTMGGVLLAFTAAFDYHRWERLAWPLLILVIASLTVVLLPGTESFAPSINGARRWLRLGPFTIQPSEFAKLVLLIWVTRTLVKKQDRLHSLRKGILPILLVSGFIAILIALEPSMSAALLVALLVGIVCFTGRARIGHFVLLGTLGAIPLWLFISSAPYRVQRILAFRDPLAHEQGASYQLVQSLTALGSGGVFGRGFGQSQMKSGFVPEPHNDFASSILGEEWGFVGIVILVLLYLAISVLGHRISRRAPDLFGSLLAIAMTSLLVVPAFLHLAINFSIIPPTGVALPFVSYGRSNLLVNFAAAGILLNIAAAGCRYRDIREHLDGDSLFAEIAETDLKGPREPGEMSAIVAY